MKVSGTPKIVKELVFKATTGKEVVVRTGDIIKVTATCALLGTTETYVGKFLDLYYDEDISTGAEGFESGIILQLLDSDSDPISEEEINLILNEGGQDLLGGCDGYESVWFSEINELERL